MEKAKVYFTKEITPQRMIDIFNALGKDLPGRVAVKLHSGEAGNQNFIRPAFMKTSVDNVNGTIVECNTAYEGSRNTSKAHWETMKNHGWTQIGTVDIMDEDGEFEIPVRGGNQIRTNYVGSHLKNYDSMLVLSHFKGHPMGGFGGALKNISIGVASSHGKQNIHSAGTFKNMWGTEQNKFLESMADAASSVVDYFKGNMAFINVMCNLSVDCDCCAVAEDPAMGDIGILASADPIAVDRACLDLVYASNDKGKEHLIERIESRNGAYIIDAALKLNFGTDKYELISID